MQQIAYWAVASTLPGWTIAAFAQWRLGNLPLALMSICYAVADVAFIWESLR